jgi:hypothetical protein
MKREVTFLKDFATKSKGDTLKCDSMLASQLVNVDKVAEYSELLKSKTTKKPK